MAARILITDPIATHRIRLSAVLRSAGHCVFTQDTLHDLADLRPDLVVLGPGLQLDAALRLFTAAQRDHAKHLNFQTLLLCDTHDPASRLKALTAGIDEIVAFPFDDAALRARIRNLIRAQTLEQEVKDRYAAIDGLGFAEAPAGFVAPSQVLSVGEVTSSDKPSPLPRAPTAEYVLKTITPDRLFDRIETCPASPDLIILPPQGTKSYDGLACVAELRTRPKTRQTALMFAYDPAHRILAHCALDMGANDIIATDSSAQEFDLRIRRLLARKRTADGLAHLLDRGLQLAATDPLTGLFNRRYALNYLERVQARSTENGSSFAAMVLDLDWFKHINDTFGHPAGDAVLVEVAERLRANLRTEDLLARIGGEEFLVIIPNTNLDAARATADRLRRVVSATPILPEGLAKNIRVTISIGLSMSLPQDGPPSSDIIKAADRALLIAKAQGRNMVETWRAAA